MGMGNILTLKSNEIILKRSQVEETLKKISAPKYYILSCVSVTKIGLENRFIGSSLVVTAISAYTLKFTVTIAHVTSHTKSSNSSSGHAAFPSELRKSSEVNSHSRILLYPLGTDHAQKNSPSVVS
jgi:hypothetical protein